MVFIAAPWPAAPADGGSAAPAAPLLAGLELGADPDHWRFAIEPVPVALFREVELFDFEQDRWRAIDMSELACRN